MGSIEDVSVNDAGDASSLPCLNLNFNSPLKTHCHHFTEEGAKFQRGKEAVQEPFSFQIHEVSEGPLMLISHFAVSLSFKCFLLCNHPPCFFFFQSSNFIEDFGG